MATNGRNNTSNEEWVEDIKSGVKDIAESLSDALRSVTSAIDEKKKTVDPKNARGTKSAGTPSPKQDYKTIKVQPPKLYKKVEEEKNGSLWQLIGGGSLFAGGGIVTAVATGVLADDFTLGGVGAILLGTFLTVLGAVLGIDALKRRALAKRFETYRALLGNKTYVTIQDLMAATGKTESQVEKELQELIEKKYFLQGHLDREGDYFITSDETFQRYEEVLVLQAKQRALLEQEEAELRASGLSTEGIRLFRKGREYVNTINRLNMEIPDPVMTEKLQTLEELIRKLLEEVQKAPGSAAEMRKLMSYYLPTTEKLVRSYHALEQKEQTPETEKTKAEIVLTMDTMNAAIAKMLEKWTRRGEWDLSTEINVLHKILAMDGLKNDGSEFSTQESVK